MQIQVNNNIYPAFAISGNLDITHQVFELKKARVRVEYNLPVDVVSVLEFTLKKDDGINKLQHFMFLSGIGVQEIDSLFFDTIVVDGSFDSEKIDIHVGGYKLLKNE